MHYLYVIVIDISSSFVSSLHASFLYGTQDGKICFVFFLVILKDATSVWRGKYFDVGGYFRFVIVQVNYDKYEWVPFFTWNLWQLCKTNTSKDVSKLNYFLAKSMIVQNDLIYRVTCLFYLAYLKLNFLHKIIKLGLTTSLNRTT